MVGHGGPLRSDVCSRPEPEIRKSWVCSAQTPPVSSPEIRLKLDEVEGPLCRRSKEELVASDPCKDFWLFLLRGGQISHSYRKLVKRKSP